MPEPSSRLAAETSPYLLQHADNPVDWYPWGDAALDLARREDKPLLLSIGYSACHWCHVMAHESFADEATAALMNEHFVNVKVDREERPDLDRIYQAAHSVLTQRTGGWPLTMFLTPDDLTPFFGGTYFPKEPTQGLPAFKDILERVAKAYRERRSEIAGQNTELKRALASIDDLPRGDDVALTAKPLHDARKFLESIHDRDFGGFGSAPKFPQVTSLERLLRHYAHMRDKRIRDKRALKMVRRTLTHICDGGIFDHIGGGFARYAVDQEWMIPHFEKMLYDNGPLLGLLADAWLVSEDPVFERSARATAGWLLREMQSPDGGFFSSVDADSEGEEGRFYVFTPEELAPVVGDRDWGLFAARYGLDRPANFEGRHHLHAARPLDEICAEAGLPEDEAAARLGEARERVFEYRSRRVPPGIDDKVLTSWNALAIKGLARAGQVFGEADWIDRATRCVDFLRANLWDGERLSAVARGGTVRLNAYLDDHVFLIDALLTLLETRWRSTDLEFAAALAERTLDGFEDPEGGGFYFTPHDHEPLLQRTKGLHDDALPSGNGVGARVLTELGTLLGEPRYLAAAERAVKRAWPAIAHAPAAHCALLDALELSLAGARTVVLRGDADAMASWRAAARRYLPQTRVFAVPADAGALPGALAERRLEEGVVAYVCEGTQCRAPITDLAAFAAVLEPGAS